MRLLIALATVAAAVVTNVSPAMAREVQSSKAALASKLPAAVVQRRNSETGKVEYAFLPKHLAKNPSKAQIAALNFGPAPKAKRAAADALGTSASSYYFVGGGWGGYGGGFGFGAPSFGFGGYSYEYSQVTQFNYGGYDYGCFNRPYAYGYGYGGGYEDYGYGY